MRFNIGDQAIYAIALNYDLQRFVGQTVTICGFYEQGYDYLLDLEVDDEAGNFSPLCCFDWQLKRRDDPDFRFHLEMEEGRFEPLPDPTKG